MSKKLYSIRDNATKFYDVITDHNDRAATRSFSHAFEYLILQSIHLPQGNSIKSLTILS